VFSLAPGYRRNLEAISRETGPGGYAADFSEAFRRIFSQDYVYSERLYAELFSITSERNFEEETEDLEEAHYSAESFLQMSRRFSSRIRDLLLPSFVELGLGKEFIKEGDGRDFVNTYSLKSQSTALNLFGNFGAYPLFPFYKTDEFSTALSLDLRTYRSSAGSVKLRSVETNLDSYLSFAGAGDNILTLENRFYLEYEGSVQWSDTVKLLYNWFKIPQDGVRVPLLPAAIGDDGYWSHSESIELELSGARDALSFHPFDLVVSHESSLILPEHGKITAEVAAGLDIEETEDGLYWVGGLRGGLEARIEF
jgi:hypothetical protein